MSGELFDKRSNLWKRAFAEAQPYSQFVAASPETHQQRWASSYALLKLVPASSGNNSVWVSYMGASTVSTASTESRIASASSLRTGIRASQSFFASRSRAASETADS